MDRKSTIAFKNVNMVDRVEPASQSTRIPPGTLITIQIGRRTDSRAEIIDFSRKMSAR